MQGFVLETGSNFKVKVFFIVWYALGTCSTPQILSIPYKVSKNKVELKFDGK